MTAKPPIDTARLREMLAVAKKPRDARITPGTEADYDWRANREKVWGELLTGFNAQADRITTLEADNASLREALEPFAKLARPKYPEPGSPSPVQAIEGKDGTGELYLGSHYGTAQYITMWSSDFEAAARALSTQGTTDKGDAS